MGLFPKNQINSCSKWSSLFATPVTLVNGQFSNKQAPKNNVSGLQPFSRSRIVMTRVLNLSVTTHNQTNNQLLKTVAFCVSSLLASSIPLFFKLCPLTDWDHIPDTCTNCTGFGQAQGWFLIEFFKHLLL